jgi:hypothetical protein
MGETLSMKANLDRRMRGQGRSGRIKSERFYRVSIGCYQNCFGHDGGKNLRSESVVDTFIQSQCSGETAEYPILRKHKRSSPHSAYQREDYVLACYLLSAVIRLGKPCNTSAHERTRMPQPVWQRVVVYNVAGAFIVLSTAIPPPYPWLRIPISMPHGAVNKMG